MWGKCAFSAIALGFGVEKEPVRALAWDCFDAMCDFLFAER